MNIKYIFLIISIIIGSISQLIGIRAIFKKEFKPHRITRFLFLIENSFFVISLFVSRERVGLFLALIQFLGSLALFILSIKYGEGGTEKIDLIITFGAIITLIIWKTTNDPIFALYMSILTDFIAFTPTCIKAYIDPYSEDEKFYMSDIIAAFFNLLALSSYLFKDLAYPLYIFVVNLFCMTIIIIRKRSSKKLL